MQLQLGDAAVRPAVRQLQHAPPTDDARGQRRVEPGQVRHEEAVLVVVPGLADVRPPEDLHAHRAAHGEPPRSRIAFWMRVLWFPMA